MTQYQVMIFVIEAISLHVCSSLPATKVPVVLSKIDQLLAVTKGAALGVAIMLLEAVEGLDREAFRVVDIFLRGGGRAVLKVRLVLINGNLLVIFNKAPFLRRI